MTENADPISETPETPEAPEISEAPEVPEISEAPKEQVPSHLVRASKITRYGLDDLCYKLLIEEGKTLDYTTGACNEDLEKRNDGEVYAEVNRTNVHNWLSKFRKRLRQEEKEKRTKQSIIESVRDLCDQLKENIASFSDLMSEKMEAGQIGDLVKVHSALHSDMKLLATIEGRINTVVPIDTFKENFLAILDIITTDAYLTTRDKQRLLTQISGRIKVDVGQRKPKTKNLDEILGPAATQPRFDANTNN